MRWAGLTGVRHSALANGAAVLLRPPGASLRSSPHITLLHICHSPHNRPRPLNVYELVRGDLNFIKSVSGPSSAFLVFLASCFPFNRPQDH